MLLVWQSSDYETYVRHLSALAKNIVGTPLSVATTSSVVEGMVSKSCCYKHDAKGTSFTWCKRYIIKTGWFMHGFTTPSKVRSRNPSEELSFESQVCYHQFHPFSLLPLLILMRKSRFMYKERIVLAEESNWCKRYIIIPTSYLMYLLTLLRKYVEGIHQPNSPSRVQCLSLVPSIQPFVLADNDEKK